MSRIISKRLCIAVSPWSGKPCKAKSVNPNTLKNGTREFLDDRFCQMHQPGVESKKKCVCPHCNYHRSKDKFPMIKVTTNAKGKETVSVLDLKNEEESQESAFGKNKTVKAKKSIRTKKK